MKNKFLSFRHFGFSKKFGSNNEIILKEKKDFKGFRNILQEEIKFEKENYVEIDRKSFEDFLAKSKFKFEEESYSTKLTLTKSQGPYFISVYCLSNPPFPSRKPEDYNGN